MCSDGIIALVNPSSSWHPSHHAPHTPGGCLPAQPSYSLRGRPARQRLLRARHESHHRLRQVHVVPGVDCERQRQGVERVCPSQRRPASVLRPHRSGHAHPRPRAGASEAAAACTDPALAQHLRGALRQGGALLRRPCLRLREAQLPNGCIGFNIFLHPRQRRRSLSTNAIALGFSV